jgi:GNAT superfamily N-acetyltransferase
MATSIREAGPEDAQLVASFIVELATYERLLAETHPSVEALQRDLAAQTTPRLYCLIAETEGVPVGFAAYYLAYSTNRTSWALHLQDIFVREAHRKAGVGSALFKKLVEAAVTHKCDSIELEVLRWNDESRGFYEHMGMVANDETVKLYLEGEALKKFSRS